MRTAVVGDDHRSAWLDIEARGWGDGLPCIAPTVELVEEMLGGQDPETSVAQIPPSGAVATNELVAVNAVMAGCDPQAMPIIQTAVRAAAEPAFNLLAIQTTTNPATVLVIVNGPIRTEASMGGGASCLGAGVRANQTIGRAVRLVMMNVGGVRPGTGDLATHGFPGKIGFCFAEAEEQSPWPALSERVDLPAIVSAVTVVAASGTINLLETSDDPDELLRSLARALAIPGSNDVMYGGTPVIVLSPEHARILAKAGLSKRDVQARLFEMGTIAASEITPSNREALLTPFRTSHYGRIEDDTKLHVADRSEDLLVVVAGGPGAHSVYIPTFGESHAVTVEVTA